MNGRHYTEFACSAPGGEFEYRHVMRSAHPEPLRVTTRGPLPAAMARAHADSLNQNDADDIRKYGDVRS